jgi:hypothetical protein
VTTEAARVSVPRRFPPYCRHCPPQWERRRSWIGHFFWPFCGRYLLGSALVGLALYVGGLTAAAIAGFPHAYFHSRIWAVAAVIAWVFAWGERSDRYLAALPEKIRRAFRDPDRDGFDKIERSWHGRLYSIPRSLGSGLLLAGVLLLLIFGDTGVWKERLPATWSSDHATAAKWILATYFLFGGALAATMVVGFIEYIRFTGTVLRNDLTLNLSVARASLRHITLFGLETGFGWSVAVALTAAFVAHGAGAPEMSLLVLLALMGFALILVPQVLAHAALAKTRDELLFETQKDLVAADEASWVLRFVKEPTEEVLRLRAFGSELDQFPLWIHSPAEGMSFLAEVVGTVAAVFALLHIG